MKNLIRQSVHAKSTNSFAILANGENHQAPASCPLNKCHLLSWILSLGSCFAVLLHAVPSKPPLAKVSLHGGMLDLIVLFCIRFVSSDPVCVVKDADTNRWRIQKIEKLPRLFGTRGMQQTRQTGSEGH
jgi:hypothetical protein